VLENRSKMPRNKEKSYAKEVEYDQSIPYIRENYDSANSN
jgi:hypothetical protein